MTLPGDLSLLHLFYLCLRRQRPVLAERYKEAAVNSAEVARANLRNRPSWFRQVWPFTKRPALALIDQQDRSQRRARYLSSAAQSAQQRFDDALRRWRAVSPLTRLLTPDSAEEAVDIESMWMPAMFSGANCHRSTDLEGLCRWLTREIVRRTPFSGAEWDCPPAELVAFLQSVVHTANGRSSPDACSCWLFLLRYYGLWARSLPKVEEILDRIGGLPDSGRQRWVDFIEPWDRVRQFASQHARSSGVDPCEKRLATERKALSPAPPVPPENGRSCCAVPRRLLTATTNTPHSRTGTFELVGKRMIPRIHAEAEICGVFACTGCVAGAGGASGLMAGSY